MTRFLAIAAAAVSIAAVPVAAQEASPDRPQVAAPASGGGSAPTTAAKKPTRYCVVERMTGSRIPTKTCLTRDEWLAQGFDPLQGDR